MNNEQALTVYVKQMGEIDNIARHLEDFADEHGYISPDDVSWETVATMNHVLVLLTQVAGFLDIDLTTDPDVYPELVQPDMFPAGEDTMHLTHLDAMALARAGDWDGAWQMAQQDDGLLPEVTREQWIAFARNLIAQ